MVDPVLVSVAGVGASVVKFLLRASGQDAVAGLVGDAQEGLGLLAGLRGRVNDRGDAVAKCIEKTVADRVRGMYQKCQDRGVGTERLDGVATGVGGLLDRVGNDDRFIVEAVRSPDRFAAMLHRRGEPIRAQLFARSEPYFDELVDAVAAEYVRLAPWSEKFQIEALKYVMGALDRIEEGVGKIQEDVGKGLENDALILESLEIVKENQNATIGGLPRPGRVVFGARPDVAAGFVERGEQQRLRGLVVDERRERVVLVGMAGCGKSQLASSLARECGAAGWGLVAWLNASSADSVRSDLVELARRLGVDTSDNPTQDQVIERCLGHLQSADAGDRLVVFDNVEDFDDLTGVVPRGGGLRVVATSRRRDVSSAWEAVEVGVFPRADSIAFVQSITGSQDSGAADALAARLGDLPLALAQAAETARIERWSLAEYLDQLDAYSSDRVIHRIPGDSYPDDVSIALLLAVESALSRIKDGSHEAARLQIGALAVLAESGVPTRWIAPGARKAQTDGNADGADEDTGADAGPVGEETKARDVAAENARRALAALLNASVVQQSTDGRVTMLHRLQGQVLRENWSQGESAEALDAATDLLDRININSLPREDADGRRQETRDLIEQLRAIGAQGYSHPLFEQEQIQDAIVYALGQGTDLGLVYEALTLDGAVNTVRKLLGADHRHAIVLQSNLAVAYEQAGRFDDAITLLENAVSRCRQVLGNAHPDTLASCNNLAHAYRAAGRLDKAVSLYEATLTQCREHLGSTHPNTFTSQRGLAYTLQVAGKINESITLLEAVLRRSRATLGRVHSVTLVIQTDLANVYAAAGMNDEALPLFGEALVEYRETLGAMHSRTLAAQTDLAKTFRAAGKFNHAIALYEDVVARRREVLGSTHPATLVTQVKLARVYRDAGCLDVAIALFESVFSQFQKVLGRTNPITLASGNSLASAYRQGQRYDDAIALYKDTRAYYAKKFGMLHPNTLVTQNDLADTYQAAARFDEAIALHGQTLDDRLRVLGPDHPHTLASRDNLAGAYYAAGRFSDAIALYKEAVAERLRVLGPDHPSTLTSRNNLASAYQAVGCLDDAIPLLEEVFIDSVRVLGPDHPSTLASRNNLAGAYYAAGRLNETIALYEDVLAQCVRVLGSDHPSTLASRRNLEVARRARDSGSASARAPEKEAPPSSSKRLCP